MTTISKEPGRMGVLPALAGLAIGAALMIIAQLML